MTDTTEALSVGFGHAASFRIRSHRFRWWRHIANLQFPQRRQRLSSTLTWSSSRGRHFEGCRQRRSDLSAAHFIIAACPWRRMDSDAQTSQTTKANASDSYPLSVSSERSLNDAPEKYTYIRQRQRRVPLWRYPTPEVRRGFDVNRHYKQSA